MFRRLAEYPPQQTNRAAGPNTSTPHRGECTYPERPVGPPNHSPGRNPGVQRYTPPKRAPGPEWMYRPARIRPHRVPGPPRVSPWAMIRRPYRAHGAARRAASTNQRAARPQQTNNSTGRLRTPAKLAGYPKGCPAFFACTNLPLRPAITIRSYRYIPFNIFFESTEKRTIFVANFHVRCR